MPLKIVSGGQTGADQAGWRAARRLGLPVGGWMPRNLETEDGPRPEFATEFGAVEADGGYKVRTQANARDSDATVWFGDPESPGGVATLRACHALGRPVFLVEPGVRPSALTAWVVGGFFEVLKRGGQPRVDPAGHRSQGRAVPDGGSGTAGRVIRADQTSEFARFGRLNKHADQVADSAKIRGDRGLFAAK